MSPHLYADVAQRPVDKSSRLAVKWFEATTGSSRAQQGFLYKIATFVCSLMSHGIINEQLVSVFILSVTVFYHITQ